ncbi:MAG: ChbG/HpnK family deacetylase, partial [Deltaproteobacteria bacterium]|nr:ChbG/HpnK family deacetylase [Deltaproteobacteria bacterium]
MAPDISLIIPIYKAEAFLAQTLETIDAHLTNTSFSWELVLAIDASPDQSLEICQQFAAIPRPYSVQILNHRNNLGKGGNVRAAMLASHGSYRIFNDCDLAYPMSEVERILKALQQGADVAIANRVHPESRYTISPKDFTYLFTRHLSSRIYNYLVNWTFLPECRDTQAGLKGFTAKAAHKLFSEQRLRGFSFDVEILHLAHQMGFTIAETPVNYVYHEEPSTINFLRDAVRMAKDIYRIHRWTRQKIYHLDPDVESEKQIVLTADDFGFSPAVNEAIVTLSKQGRIGATSLLVNLPASAQAFELAKVHGLDVGWHANLTFGPPVCAPGEVPSLVDEQGTFFPLRTFLLKMLRKQIEVADVRKELAAQYALFSQHQLKISHVDGHQHVHVLPGISRVLGELLSSTPGIFVRVPR